MEGTRRAPNYLRVNHDSLHRLRKVSVLHSASFGLILLKHSSLNPRDGAPGSELRIKMTINQDYNRLVKYGRPAEAMAVLSALDDKPMTNEQVQQTFHAIVESVALEELGTYSKESVIEPQKPRETKVSLKELFTGGRSQNFRRVSLGVAIQCFQQVIILHLHHRFTHTTSIWNSR